ncbi:MAG: YbaB/EbfC family nucleoid-associated protein [Spirochaetaceae bacterium]|jgi:DNA-binding YbaB/EbfC family protein|nr:YbaB/EbfC family nucleoid-associated protein [Spirochaetaceae bacterium]
MTINPLDLMKNLQKLQEHVGDMQEQLDDVTVTGSAGGGMVEVDMNGKLEVLAVRIAKEAWLPTGGGAEPDIEMVQDLIVAACADAGEKSRQQIQSHVGSMAQTMGIPPGILTFGGP